ncbi:hypothetical protein HCH54_005248 [Aspergillus fumigatus]
MTAGSRRLSAQGTHHHDCSGFSDVGSRLECLIVGKFDLNVILVHSRDVPVKAVSVFVSRTSNRGQWHNTSSSRARVKEEKAPGFLCIRDIVRSCNDLESSYSEES